MTSDRRLDVKVVVREDRFMATRNRTTDRTAFTLRFEEETTHQALRLCAGELGVSMSSLAESLIAQQLRVVAANLADQLSETLTALRSYHGEGADKDLAAFAAAEVDEEDPIQTRLISLEPSDPYEMSALFRGMSQSDRASTRATPEALDS
jgi:hypothetical protein